MSMTLKKSHLKQLQLTESVIRCSSSHTVKVSF